MPVPRKDGAPSPTATVVDQSPIACIAAMARRDDAQDTSAWARGVLRANKRVHRPDDAITQRAASPRLSVKAEDAGDPVEGARGVAGCHANLGCETQKTRRPLQDHGHDRCCLAGLDGGAVDGD